MCVWRMDDDGLWFTSCAHLFELADGGPDANGMRWCPFCGHPLVDAHSRTYQIQECPDPVTFADLAEANDADTMTAVAGLEIGGRTVVGMCDEIVRLT